MSRKKFINAKLKSVNELQEILTDHGVFQEISPRISAPDCEIIDLQGKLILPPYVDPHIHLDYVFTARKQGAANGTGTLFEGIQRWSETKSDLTVDEIKARALISSTVRSLFVSLHLWIPSNRVPVPFAAPCFLAVNT